MWLKKSALQTSHSTCHGGRGECSPRFDKLTWCPCIYNKPSSNKGCSGLPVGGTMQTSN